MSRSGSFWLCAALGLLLLALGWLIPAHLRALDSVLVERAGKGTPSLLSCAQDEVALGKIGPARMLAETARRAGVPGYEKISLTLGNLALAQPALLAWGGPAPGFGKYAGIDSKPATNTAPFTDIIVRLGNRQKLLELLAQSPNAAIQQLLDSRQLTNTVVFTPSSSASGQAFDTAVCVSGLLLLEAHLSPGLSNSVYVLAANANRLGNTERFEQMLLDFMSLGQRLDWTQLCEFVSKVQDAEQLRVLTMLARQAGGNLAVLFSAVTLSGQPAEVTQYLSKFSVSGLDDLARGMRDGTGGVRELLRHGQRWHQPLISGQFAVLPPFNMFVPFAMQAPEAALFLKWLLYLLAGFLFAAAVHYALPAVAPIERPLQVRGFHIAREVLFALGFLLVLLLFSEPFLSQESQRVEFPFKVHLPTGVGVVTTAKTVKASSIMQQMSLLTLLLFFVLQALIYTACLFKLGEIRRQNVPPRMKLVLLANEEHLFDAGLYLGFVGTIISLILVSLGIIKPSLMAAYSSTSFGIIFVSIFKIFHLRPVRRRLLLEAESAGGNVAASPAGLLATQS